MAAGPGSLAHLAARFVTAVLARPPSDADRAWLASRLGPDEMSAFLDQPVHDQRHGLDAARWVASSIDGRPDLVRAAALHDIGKRHSGLGVAGRVIASLAMKLGLPLTRRQAAYRDHGVLGAKELRELGAEPLVWRYAACHHGQPDPVIDESDLALLDRADRVHPARMPGKR